MTTLVPLDLQRPARPATLFAEVQVLPIASTLGNTDPR
jgi:hypothetical protein